MKKSLTDLLSEINNQRKKVEYEQYELSDIKELILKINSLDFNELIEIRKDVIDFYDILFINGINLTEIDASIFQKRDSNKTINKKIVNQNLTLKPILKQN